MFWEHFVRRGRPRAMHVHCEVHAIAPARVSSHAACALPSVWAQHVLRSRRLLITCALPFQHVRTCCTNAFVHAVSLRQPWMSLDTGILRQLQLRIHLHIQLRIYLPVLPVPCYS